MSLVLAQLLGMVLLSGSTDGGKLGGSNYSTAAVCQCGLAAIQDSCGYEACYLSPTYMAANAGHHGMLWTHGKCCGLSIYVQGQLINGIIDAIAQLRLCGMAGRLCCVDGRDLRAEHCRRGLHARKMKLRFRRFFPLVVS